MKHAYSDTDLLFLSEHMAKIVRAVCYFPERFFPE